GVMEYNRVFCPLEESGMYLSFDMTIYNRWGNEVWHQCCKNGVCPRYHDSGFWWDGTDSQGKPLSAGVYFYVVKAVPSQSGSRPLLLKGSVTLFR
ncbi:MAG: gliding motility-associated C-terminal domain-containing protein, partial [Bacteroidales bacterium]|nr:gliding motility-associated C-terminal domain-containing protein [Bacteroidales bacterium]